MAGISNFRAHIDCRSLLFLTGDASMIGIVDFQNGFTSSNN